jgi:hypothetical protein
LVASIERTLNGRIPAMNLKEVKRSRWSRHYHLARPAIAEVKPMRQKKG